MNTEQVTNEVGEKIKALETELNDLKKMNSGLWDMVEDLSVKLFDKTNECHKLKAQLVGASLLFEQIRYKIRDLKNETQARVNNEQTQG